MDAEDGPGLRTDDAGVVPDPGAVGRADLHEAGAGLGEDVGDAEAVADLDQLAAADGHVPPGGERRQDQHHGRGVVVDGHAVLRARQLREDRAEMGVARPAHAGVQVVLQVRVAARNARDPLDRRGRKRRSAQVRVHDDAGGVERRAQARRSVELPLGPREELLGSLGDASPAGIGERRPDRLDGGRDARGARRGRRRARRRARRRRTADLAAGDRPWCNSMPTRAQAETPDPLCDAVVRPPPAAAAPSAGAAAGRDRRRRGLGTARHGGVRDPPPVAADRPRRRRHRRPGPAGGGRRGRGRLRRSTSSPGTRPAARRTSMPAPPSSSIARPGGCCGRRTHTVPSPSRASPSS